MYYYCQQNLLLFIIIILHFLLIWNMPMGSVVSNVCLSKQLLLDRVCRVYIVLLFTGIPIQLHFSLSHWLSAVSKKILNNIGDKLSPRQRPLVILKDNESLLPIFTFAKAFVYISLTALIGVMFIGAWSSIRNSCFVGTEPQAFVRSTSIPVTNIFSFGWAMQKMLSIVDWPALNPHCSSVWYSF